MAMAALKAGSPMFVRRDAALFISKNTYFGLSTGGKFPKFLYLLDEFSS